MSRLGPIVLFDLDGTVVTFRGARPSPGRLALSQAMLALHGVDDACEGLRFAGGTDRALCRAILRRAGIGDDDAAIARVLDAYLGALEAVLTERSYDPVGDVTGAVQALRARRATVGVATGNVREGARLKLASARLGATFDLALGGYGCDAELRADIVRVAAERCAVAAGGGPRGVIVVGDTAEDVRAARALGAAVVGVAMHEEARAELAAAGADAVVEACGAELVAAVFAI
jgi:phosphoglycolate phosphatase-like HAD superfamily hydrolase